MGKKILIVVSILVTITLGFYVFLKVNPPLEINTLAATNDQKSVVVGVGNKGFTEMKIVDVLVNHEEIPKETNYKLTRQ